MLQEALQTTAPVHAGREIIPRHDVDRVLLQLRKKDVENPTDSKKMQWLQKKVFKGEKLEAIYDRSKELFKAATHEHRDVSPTSKKPINLANAERPILFRRNEEGTRAGEHKSEDVKNQYSDAIESALRRYGYKGDPVQVVNHNELPSKIQESVKPGDYGYTSRGGKMVVNATAHNSVADAVFTAFHEAFHRGELGTEARPYADALASARRNRTVGALADQIAAKATARGETLPDTLVTREALAEINAAKRTGNWGKIKDTYGVEADALGKANAGNVVTKFIGRAKDFFQKVLAKVTGRDVEMSDRQVHELVDNIFNKINDKVTNTSDDLLLSRGNDNLANYRKSLVKRLAKGSIDRAKFDTLYKAAQNKYQSMKQYVEPHPSLVNPKQTAQQTQSTTNAIANGTNKLKDAAKFAVDVRRMSALSGIMTLAKLSGAVAYRIAQSPLETAVASGLKRIPGISSIAKGAVRYGQGFDSGVEGKVLQDTFSKNTLDQMKKAFTTGKIDIDKFRRVSDAMTKDLDEEVAPTRPVMDFFVRIHKAIKTVAQMNEFSRSSRLRSQYELAQYIADGKSPAEAKALLNSEEVQNRIGVEAYADSQRAILMQDNKLHQALEKALQRGESSEYALPQAAAFGAKMLMPVRKVPINYATEAMEHLVGGINVTPKLVKALRQGAGSLSPQEKDYILRNLSRQTIGATLVALGIAYANKIGGYYQGPQDYKQKDHPHPGDIDIGGTDITHKVTHSPALELLQMAATYQHVANQKNGRAGALAAGEGFAKTLPFVDQYARLSEAAKSQYAQDKYVNNLVKGFVIPTGVNDIATMLDTMRNPGVTGRKTKGLEETLQSGIPIAREQLPAYKD